MSGTHAQKLSVAELIARAQHPDGHSRALPPKAWLQVRGSQDKGMHAQLLGMVRRAPVNLYPLGLCREPAVYHSLPLG